MSKSANNEETLDHSHLWRLFEDIALAIREDLNAVRTLKLYNGAPRTIMGDIYLQEAIRKAEEILAHLLDARQRRDDWIERWGNIEGGTSEMSPFNFEVTHD